MIDVLMLVSKWVNLVDVAFDCCSESRGVESVPVVGYSNQFPFIPFIASDEVIVLESSIFGSVF